MTYNLENWRWKGKTTEELTREELLEIVAYYVWQAEDNAKHMDRVYRTWETCRKIRTERKSWWEWIME